MSPGQRLHKSRRFGSNYPVMSDDLSVLESRVDELIDLCEALARENHILRERNRSWAVERADLLERNEVAKSKVEAMIERLKSLDGE